MRTIETRVAGVTFDNRQGKIAYIAKNRNRAYCFLKAEPNNAYDSNAVAVYAGVAGAGGKRTKIGYIPKDLAPEIAGMREGELWIADFKVNRGRDTYGVKLTIGCRN